MRKTTEAALVLAVLIAACGGERDVVPPPQAPLPPPATAAAPPPAAEPAPPPAPPKPTLLELQKQLAQSTLAAINAHDAKKFSETFTPDATITMYGAGEIKGREAIEGDLRKFFDAFPDFKLGSSKVFVKDDIIVNEWVMNGTHKGEFMGVKPTGKPVGLRGVSVVWVTPEGLAKQEHRYFDVGTLMAQLGEIKAPARPVPALPAGDPEWHIAKGSGEEAKQVDLVKAMYMALDKKAEPDFLAVLDEKIVWSDLSAPKDMSSKPEAKKFFQMFTKAFSDMKNTLDQVILADDYVVIEVTTNAVHSGQLGPFKATKKPVVLHGVDIMIVKDGKIHQGTSYLNGMELPAQEGLLAKPKAETKAKEEKPKDKAAADGKEKAADKGDHKADAKPKAAEPKSEKK